MMFNLGIPDKVVDKLIDLADYDGDGTINYAEFARIFTAESWSKGLDHTRSSVSCACIYDVAVASTSLREVHALPPAPNTARDGSVRGHWYTLRGCVVLLVTSRSDTCPLCHVSPLRWGSAQPRPRWCALSRPPTSTYWQNTQPIY